MKLDIPRPESEWRTELAADLRAIGAPDRNDWVSEPSLLRRVAALLAREIPPAADSVLAVGDRAESLATALSLTTGLPSITLPAASSSATRRLAVVAIRPAPTADEALLELQVCAKICLYPGDGDEEWEVALPSTRPQQSQREGGTTMELNEALSRVTISDGSATWIDLGNDTHAASTLAHHIANSLRDQGATHVASWRHSEDVVLAQLVAAELNVPRITVAEEEGLLSTTLPIPVNSHVGWVAVTDRSRRESVDILLAGSGSTLAAFVTLTSLKTT